MRQDSEDSAELGHSGDVLLGIMRVTLILYLVIKLFTMLSVFFSCTRKYT
jgi:hypothetical protein